MSNELSWELKSVIRHAIEMSDHAPCGCDPKTSLICWKHLFEYDLAHLPPQLVYDIRFMSQYKFPSIEVVEEFLKLRQCCQCGARDIQPKHTFYIDGKPIHAECLPKVKFPIGARVNVTVTR